jgi:hypothetical protein
MALPPYQIQWKSEQPLSSYYMAEYLVCRTTDRWQRDLDWKNRQRDRWRKQSCKVFFACDRALRAPRSARYSHKPHRRATYGPWVGGWCFLAFKIPALQFIYKVCKCSSRGTSNPWAAHPDSVAFTLWFQLRTSFPYRMWTFLCYLCPEVFTLLPFHPWLKASTARGTSELFVAVNLSQQHGLVRW